MERENGGVVVLPDGRSVRGRALHGGLPAGAEVPEFGLYLTARPHQEGSWESRWTCWPDFRLPRSSSEAIAALREAYERSSSSRVEIACDGGTGRTGTAIAILARYAGVPSDEAVMWVRANYRLRAVETPWQRRFVARTDLSR
ncbi:protein-tyrosine phosphatase family protein [Oerskovia sp. M15]